MPIQSLLRRMVIAGWKPGPPVPAAEIASAEEQLGVIFPRPYRDFLVAAGSTPPESAWRGLWNVREMLSLNRSLPLFRWFGGIVGIGNEGFIVTALDFRSPTCCVVSLGMSSSDWSEVTREAESFEEWLEGTVPPVG